MYSELSMSEVDFLCLSRKFYQISRFDYLFMNREKRTPRMFFAIRFILGIDVIILRFFCACLSLLLSVLGGSLVQVPKLVKTIASKAIWKKDITKN